MHIIPTKRLHILTPYLFSAINTIVPELFTTQANEITLSLAQLRQLSNEGISLHFLLTGKFDEFNHKEKGRALQHQLDFDREQNAKEHLATILSHNFIDLCETPPSEQALSLRQ